MSNGLVRQEMSGGVISSSRGSLPAGPGSSQMPQELGSQQEHLLLRGKQGLEGRSMTEGLAPT